MLSANYPANLYYYNQVNALYNALKYLCVKPEYGGSRYATKENIAYISNKIKLIEEKIQ